MDILRFFLIPLPQAIITISNAIIRHEKIEQQKSLFMSFIAISLPLYFFISCMFRKDTVEEAITNMENLNMPYLLFSTYVCFVLQLFIPTKEIDDDSAEQTECKSDTNVSQFDEETEAKVKEVEIQEHKREDDYEISICTMDKITSLLLFISFVMLESIAFIQYNFGKIEEEQLIFHMNLKTAGSEANQYIIAFIIKCIIVPFIFRLIITYALQNSPDYFCFNWIVKFRIRFFKNLFQMVFFVYCVYLFYSQVPIIQAMTPKKSTTFIEDHYVKPTKDILTYPQKSRNFIFLCLESFETSFSSKKFGGGFDVNHIPLMTNQALRNVHFGTKNTIGGGVYTTQASWSIAGNFAMWSGLPLKWSTINQKGIFAPGATTVLDILAERGYDQTVIYGHKDGFGVGALYGTHGKFRVLDSVNIKKEYPKYKNDRGGWGLSDQGLYDVAKDIINEKSKSEAPFMLVINTIETHFPDGIYCKLCKKETDWKYFDVIRCADRQANAFLEYLKKTPKYNETTIVVVGDHTTMSSGMGKKLKGYQRKIYHTIINPCNPYTPTKVERKFSSFDWFPTILAALGFKIKGDRLGLGVNLFSKKKTLLEEMGGRFMSEVGKPSLFYDKKIMFSDDNGVKIYVTGKWC